MKPPARVLFACLMLIVLLSGRPLWAQTYAYIPSFGNNNVVRATPATGAFATFAFGAAECSPYGAAVDPDGSYVIVTCAGADQNRVYFLTDMQFSATPGIPGFVGVGVRPRGVAIAPDGSYAYVANSGVDASGNASVTIIDAVSKALITTVPVPNAAGLFSAEAPWGIAAVQSGAAIKAYVANYVNGSVSVITHNGGAQISQTIPVGALPAGVTASPDGATVYVALSGSSALGVIRTSDDTLTNTINVGQSPWGLALGSRGRFLYASNTGFNSVSVIRASDLTLVDTVGAGARPHGIAAPANADFAWTINRGIIDPAPATISRISMETGAPVATLVSMPTPNPLLDSIALGAFIGGTPPAAPSNLAGSASDYDRIDLTWTDNSSDELGFIIERRQPGETGYAEVIQTAAGATSYTDNSVASEATYQYRIRSFNETSYSPYAASSDITTPEGDFHWCFIGTLTGESFRKAGGAEPGPHNRPHRQPPQGRGER